MKSERTLEAVDMPLVGNCLHATRESLYDGVISRCVDCGLGMTVRVPDFAYESGYFTADGDGGYNFDSALALALDEARFGAELTRIEQQGLRGSILDIGCATGTFLAIAQGRGWTPAGVEIAEFGRQEANLKLGANAVVASLDDLSRGARYDVVTMHHVLEHVHEPLAFLRHAVVPRVGRRLVIEVPNFDSLGSRVEGSAWRDLRPEQHVYHYTAASLAEMVTAAGLRVVRTYTLGVAVRSIRSNVELMRLAARAAVTPDRRASSPRAASASPSTPASQTPSVAFAPPTGARATVTTMIDLATSPLRQFVERVQLGERLAIEAEPAEAR